MENCFLKWIYIEILATNSLSFCRNNKKCLSPQNCLKTPLRGMCTAQIREKSIRQRGFFSFIFFPSFAQSLLRKGKVLSAILAVKWFSEFAVLFCSQQKRHNYQTKRIFCAFRADVWIPVFHLNPRNRVQFCHCNLNNWPIRSLHTYFLAPGVLTVLVVFWVNILTLFFFTTLGSSLRLMFQWVFVWFHFPVNSYLWWFKPSYLQWSKSPSRTSTPLQHKNLILLQSLLFVARSLILIGSDDCVYFPAGLAVTSTWSFWHKSNTGDMYYGEISRGSVYETSINGQVIGQKRFQFCKFNQSVIFLIRSITFQIRYFWRHWTVADPGFSRGGGANPKGGAPTYILANFSRKLHENEEILGQRGGAHPSRPP